MHETLPKGISHDSAQRQLVNWDYKWLLIEMSGGETIRCAGSDNDSDAGDSPAESPMVASA